MIINVQDLFKQYKVECKKEMDMRSLNLIKVSSLILVLFDGSKRKQNTS